MKRQEEVLQLFKNGAYWCSEDGDVHSAVASRARNRGKKLSPRASGRGYRAFSLCPSPRKRIYIYQHHLVWLYFNRAIPNGLVINHKNAIKHDNRLANLEVVSPRQNYNHAMERRLYLPPRKLNNRQVSKIKQLLGAGVFQWKIAKRFKCAQSNISAIKTGKTFSIIPNH